MNILKFGSATIADASKIRYIADLVKNEQNNIVVLSSIRGFSEHLENISNYFYNKNIEGAIENLNLFIDDINLLIDDLFNDNKYLEQARALVVDMQQYIREFDGELFTLFEKRALLAQGELLSTSIFKLHLEQIGISTFILPALDFMRMDKNHNPDMVYIRKALNEVLERAPKNAVYITQGYICRNSYGEIDDLHKGGSDFTAAILGAALKVGEVSIWGNSDVIYNNDKTIFPDAKVVCALSFDEAAELAYFGSKILHPTCIFPAKLEGIPVRLKNIYNPLEYGTLISNHTTPNVIKAVGSRSNITFIRIKSGRMLLAHGFLRKVFEIFERHETAIDMLASSEIGISLTIDNSSKINLIEEELKRLGTVIIKTKMIIVSIIGDKIIQTAPIAEKILNTIKDIPVEMISYGGSELNISFLIKYEDRIKTLESLNKNLFNN